MVLKEPKNRNYAATVVELKHFQKLENCDKIKAALIFGNSVIVGNDAKEGDIGLFFPVETALSDEFLAANNLYRKPEWGNVNKEAKGFFEQSGRVKCVRFRGHKSEGFYLPISCLHYITMQPRLEFNVGDTFDELNGQPICHKYVSRRNPGRLHPAQARQAKLIDQIVPNQFRFHPDTENLRRNIYKIHPSDYISISDKWHGTSVVISKVLVQRTLPWYERLLKRLGVHVQIQEYGLVYSSRKVVKAVNGVEKTNNHWYGEDIWGVVAKEVQDRIPAGYTLYGEIVGYTPEGSPIQAGYHYGCPVGKHKFLVYRVTCTNAEGLPLELTWQQMFDFCKKYNFEMVKELFYGRAWDLVECTGRMLTPEDGDKWHEEFLKILEENWVHDQMCEHNNYEVPAEGVVVRIDGLNECNSFKMKNFQFLCAESKALDKEVLDIETEESLDVES